MTDSRKTDKNPVEDMQRLQDLILGEEKDRLHRLDRRVSDIEARTGDVAEVLPAAMNRVAGDPANRPEFERPVVNTIRTAIKRDTHSFAEALFPVLGPAIRRAVADALKSMVQRINVALENSFTIKGLRWRLESARTGVPFAQIVLRHTMRYAIQEAFLIQRGSGLVLSSVHRDESLALDEDAVASMLTAIQSFIQDSFGMTGDEPLRSAELGEQTMWVINGPVAVLACVITGTPPRSVRDELMDLLETLHARFGEGFRDRPEELADNSGLQALMGEALLEEADEEIRSTARFKYRIIWAVAGLVLLAWLVFSSVTAWREHTFRDSAESAFRSAPGYVITGSQMRNGVLALEGLRDPVASPPEGIMHEHGIAAERISLNLEPYQSLESEIVLQRLRRQHGIGDEAGLALEGTHLLVSGALSGSQVEALEVLPGSHALIQSVDLGGVRYPADEAAEMIREALSAPETVHFLPSDDSLAVSGISSAAWYASARESRVNSGGWTLDFSPLESGLTGRLDELRDELDGSVFLFTNGTDMTAESESALLVVGAHLAEAQQLAGALGRELTIVLEGLGDGIDTFEKNREVARNRTEQILGEMMEVGLRPENIRHTIGEWREGGMDLERRRVTLRLDWGEGT